ncbi:ABC transporter ATP-binding protein [Methylomonas sp. MED-D]|uniref:ABC transporter ATP-binding protein n=1 Tax=unclassified Methylomonas TaxID=2608980 RepID=UPI0028A4BCBC|nr:ABC transporter ATP-binding protein [Methylomonas sp. MV1]MDT4328978.1 ABC transporter ATP-binding protein [Methylomonas sp. MV1]
MVDDYVIRVDRLSKRYELGKHSSTQPVNKGVLGGIARLFNGGTSDESSSIWALKDVSFEIKRGERLGFVGKNGAGKSTLLKILSRVVYPSSGEARIRGRVTSLLEVGTGFLNHLTGRQNIYLNASFHGLTKRETDQRFEDIVEFSELQRFIDTPIKFYSSGMRARLAFSVAAHLDPDVLLLDEVLSVGDMAFAKKCLERVEELTHGDRTILFVSHSMDSVRRFCNRCIWLDRGQVVMDGAADKVTDAFTQDSMTLSSHQRWISNLSSNSSRVSVGSEPIKAVNQVSGPGLPDPPHARLVEATVYDAEGRQTSTVCVTDEIKLEVVFEVFFDRATIVPYFRVITDGDLLAFNAVYTNFNSVLNNCRIGKYRASAVIPANLLNSGRYSITVGLCTPSTGKIMRHDEAVKALSIYVHEAPFGVLSSLGPYSKVPGTVRPLLKWSEQEVLNH